MKLTVISFLPFFEASRIRRQAISTIDSIQDVVDVVINDISSSFNVTALAAHGCHCGILDNADFENHGIPVDDRDHSCRSWKMSRRCITLPGGACNGAADLSYDKINLHSGCVNLSGCQKSICDIDYEFYQAVFNNYNITELQAGTDCQAQSKEATDSCCVSSNPTAYKTYNSDSSQCSNGAVSPKPQPVDGSSSDSSGLWTIDGGAVSAVPDFILDNLYKTGGWWDISGEDGVYYHKGTSAVDCKISDDTCKEYCESLGSGVRLPREDEIYAEFLALGKGSSDAGTNYEFPYYFGFTKFTIDSTTWNNINWCPNQEENPMMPNMNPCAGTSTDGNCLDQLGCQSVAKPLCIYKA